MNIKLIIKLFNKKINNKLKYKCFIKNNDLLNSYL